MANATLILDKRNKKNDGTYRICVRLYHSESQLYLPTGYSVLETDWNPEKEAIKASCTTLERPKEINALLLKKKTMAVDIIDKLTRAGEIEQLTLNELRNRILNKSEKLSFFDFTDRLIEELILGKSYGNAKVYEGAKAAVKRYFQNLENLYFHEINYKFLKTFEALYKGKNESVGGLNMHMRTINAIYNRAIKEGKLPENSNPFKKYSIPKAERHITALSINDIWKIEKYECEPGSSEWYTKSVFLFSFYCMGMNFMDIALLKMKNIQQDRIHYKRSKTGRNYSIKISNKTKAILDYYTPGKKPNDYIFPIIKGKREIYTDEITEERNLFNHRLKRFGKKLGLSKNLHSYLSRHAWANIAKNLDIPVTVISEGLGHKNIKTTQTYLDNFESDVLDEANAIIIGDQEKSEGKYVSMIL